MPKVVDFFIYKHYNEVADYTTFHQHLEDVAHDFPDIPIDKGVQCAAYRSVTRTKENNNG